MRWAGSEPTISAVILIGSRARDSIGSADSGSDWDFQIISARPEMFRNPQWAAAAGLSTPLAYAPRLGRLGRVTKISCIFAEGEVDIALLPLWQLRLGRWMAASQMVLLFPPARRALAEIGMVLAPGHRILKDTQKWTHFFHYVTCRIPPTRLSDEDICLMAEAFVCDYVSARRKIDRGELLAAQRWLHVNLVDCNFKLMHELRLRANQISFPDARRIELLGKDCWYQALAVNALVTHHSMLEAVEHSAITCRRLMHVLVGEKWRWPELYKIGVC